MKYMLIDSTTNPARKHKKPTDYPLNGVQGSAITVVPPGYVFAKAPVGPWARDLGL
jgi:hypothetical protein